MALLAIATSTINVLRLLRAADSPRVFISYRRTDDLNDVEDRLWEEVVRSYGFRNVFLDRQSIPYGKPYPVVLSGWYASSDVVIALVGSCWDGGAETADYPRVLHEFDWVRHEVEEGLASNRLVLVSVCEDIDAETVPGIPVYDVDDLKRWKREEQYKLLKALSNLQAIRIGKRGDGVRIGQAQILKEIKRRQNRQQRLLIRGTALALWMLVVAAVLGLSSLGLGLQRAAKLAEDKTSVDRKLDEHEKHLRNLNPTPVVPYTLAEVVDVVQQPKGLERLNNFKGSYVWWKVRLIDEKPKAGDLEHVYAILTPVEREDYVVKANIPRSELEKAKDCAQKHNKGLYRLVGNLEGVFEATELPNGTLVSPAHVFVDNAKIFPVE